jgi:hypothetical protein
VAIPILIEILSKENFVSESQFRMAYAHIEEISDYCVDGKAIEKKLRAVLRKSMEGAFGCGRLNADAFERLMVEWNFRADASWMT